MQAVIMTLLNSEELNWENADIIRAPKKCF